MPNSLIPPPAVFSSESIREWLERLPEEKLVQIAVQMEYEDAINALPEMGDE